MGNFDAATTRRKIKTTIPSSLGVRPSIIHIVSHEASNLKQKPERPMLTQGFPPPDPPITVIGLGSNLGDRRATIEAAIDAISKLPGVEVVARSTLWRTDPFPPSPPHGHPQPDFYNAAIAIRNPAPLDELMADLLAIEARFGRTRGEKNAPRTLDLDLLWVEGKRIRISEPGRPEVEVPHPRLHERPFALVPLLEVAPGAADPTTGKLYALLLAELGAEGVAPLDSSGA